MDNFVVFVFYVTLVVGAIVGFRWEMDAATDFKVVDKIVNQNDDGSFKCFLKLSDGRHAPISCRFIDLYRVGEYVGAHGE